MVQFVSNKTSKHLSDLGTQLDAVARKLLGMTSNAPATPELASAIARIVLLRNEFLLNLRVGPFVSRRLLGAIVSAEELVDWEGFSSAHVGLDDTTLELLRNLETLHERTRATLLA